MLRYSENLCLALAFSNAAALLWLWTGGVPPESLKLPLLGGFALFFVLMLSAIGHVAPLARARRTTWSDLDEPDGLSSRDVRTLLALAPSYQKRVAWVGVAVLVIALVAFGGVSWSTGQAFERRHALGIALYVAALASILNPVLGALSRLPGSLEERIAFLRRNDV